VCIAADPAALSLSASAANIDRRWAAMTVIPTWSVPDGDHGVGGTLRLVPHMVAAIRHPAAWAIVYGLIVTDAVWCASVGLSTGGWQTTICMVGILLGVSICYRRRSRDIADMAEAGALWLAFGSVGCVLTYLGATCAWPLHDTDLTDLDQVLGFHWLAWRNAVLATPALHLALLLAYASLLPQIAVSVVLFPAIGRSQRSFELLALAELTLLPTALISMLYPALGPFGTFGGEEATFLPDALALRLPGPWHFDLPTMQGIVTMPSYHTVLAVLLTYAYRGTGPVGWGVTGLNVLMLLAIPPIGGHYAVDVIAGGAIAMVFIVALRWWSQGESNP
jgi:hypothetical protein